MTLLESLAALVILGTTAVGFLEVFHATARATRDAGEWTRVTTHAESVMEQTKLESGGGAPPIEAADDLSTRIEQRAWAPGVTEVIVVVTTRDGRRLELRRLTRDREGSTPGALGSPR